MSKKATRRAARQAFPKTPPKPDRAKTYGQRTPRKSRSSTSAGRTRPSLRPPSLKRAAIQGVILAILYIVVIRFFWQQPGTNTLTYVIMGVLFAVGFIFLAIQSLKRRIFPIIPSVFLLVGAVLFAGGVLIPIAARTIGVLLFSIALIWIGFRNRKR